MASLLAERRKEPQDDLISSLTEGSDAAAEPELVGLCLSLLLAGHETTASLIPDIVEVLLERPTEWQRLRDDPALIPSAAEELTRFIPLQRGSTFPRYAKEDVEVGGTTVKAGEAALVSINAANRDPGQFEEPDELRLDREPSQHLGYGYGLHYCLGIQLARLEVQEALRALLQKMPDLRIAGETAPKPETAIRGFTKYVVGW
jgi:cytochrome P450